jgi:diguanylate cyclase (GGDEF)-like protein
VGAALGRDTDFVAWLRSLVTSVPNLDNAQFKRAILGVGAGQRYPGGIGYGYFERVPASGLTALKALQRRDAPEGVMISAGTQVTPPGARASYCLLRFGYAPPTPSPQTLPAGLDVCAPGGLFGTSGPVAAAANGQFVVAALPGGTLAIAAPVYAGGYTPATTAGRQEAFAGWATATLAGAGVIPAESAISGLRIQVLFHSAGASSLAVVAQEGRAPGRRAVVKSLPVESDGQWVVTVRGVPTGAGSSWVQPGVVLGAGLLFSTTLFGFVQVLARSRRRALRLVDRRTGELHHQALHDTLTGLPNRALILDRAEQMLARGRRDHLAPAALFIDLDGFKDVNDTYGHRIGDLLLQAVAARISATLRERDSAGRLGGDEFVVLVEGKDVGPDMVAERLLAVLRESFVLDEANHIEVSVRASIGIAAGDRASAGELLHDADTALYRAKEDGGDRYAIFSTDMQIAARDQVALRLELRGALAAGEFFLAYQPTFSLRDLTVTGVEALIRWRHPSRGIVPPDDFIPIAEDTGLIIPIGRWVLESACAEAATWQTPGRRLSVAVNVSGRQLDTDGLVDDVRAALDHSGLAPDLLTLEITETALVHDAAGGAIRLHDLKALGIRIAIDDFGTGYSSLNYLRQFPADAVKVDRSFISAMADSPQSAVIVRTLIQLGKALGIETLAEGIEERTQLEHLQQQDCDAGQGFLFARPLSPEALQQLINPRTPLVAATP